MITPHTPASITVRSRGMTAVYQGGESWSIQSRRDGRKTVGHESLVGMLGDNSRGRRAKKEAK